MAPKKKDGSKDYPVITIEENQAIFAKLETLIQRIGKSAQYIDDAEQIVAEENTRQFYEREWQNYISCDPLPKAHQPHKIREFFAKSVMVEDRDIELTTNWILGVDEHSILTQDIDAANRTFKYLWTLRKNFGALYNLYINEALEIFTRNQEYLINPRIEVTRRVMKDIQKIKYFVFSCVKYYIDKLTYRILESEDGNMVTLSARTAEYRYTGEHFRIHLWTFKNVPLGLNPEAYVFMHLGLTEINMMLRLPYAVLCENLVLRGFLSDFDHFSCYARFHDVPAEVVVETDLRQCLKDEWDTRTRLQKEIRITLKKIRLDWEEAQRIKQEEEELKAKQRKEAKQPPPPPRTEKSKPKKEPKEPVSLQPNQVPEVREDFLVQDEQQFIETKMKYNPAAFKLAFGEINLRKYQLLGGIYQINIVSKPNVCSLPRLIMSWYLADVSVNYKNVLLEIDPEDDTDFKLFKITFCLPDYLCRWNEPIACLFQEGFTYDFLAGSPSQQFLEVATPVIITDFNINELFTRPMMYTFIENSIPKIISSFKLPEDLRRDDEGKKAKATLGRKKLTLEELERQREIEMERNRLSFSSQICPERLFPLFKKVVPVVIVPKEDEEPKEKAHAYENFSELYEAIEEIKENYKKPLFYDLEGNPVKISINSYMHAIGQAQEVDKVVVTENEPVPSPKMSITSAEEVEHEEKPEKEEKEGEKVEKKSKKKHKKKEIVVEEEVVEEVVDDTIYTSWSTVNIIKKEFDPSKKELSIWTDRLGTFAFATDRYEHFPFEKWTILPNPFKADTVNFLIFTRNVMFNLYVSPEGYTALITDYQKGKARNDFLVIKEPITEIRTLKQKFQERNLNIFSEPDAAWYIKGYFSEKHVSTEFHTYDCICLYALKLKFVSSIWNKLSTRRNMLLQVGEVRDPEEDLSLVRITPEEVTFVEVKELCTDMNSIELEYTKTWRNFEWYADLNYLILSLYGEADEWRTQDPKLLVYLRRLLQAVKPLSSS